ncbi:hypothetical protein F6X37_35280, partial [Paraburkholderia sp. 31.1]|uniref:hypothetical protein n=1 Tax=Paraburkholderia sp. 31.1 TaxID=2615205 RepID=UPI0016557DB8
MSDDFRRLFPQYDELRQLTSPLKEMQEHLRLLGDARRHLGMGSEMMELLRQEAANRKTVLGLTDLTNIARDFERQRALLEGPIEQARRLGLLDPYSDIRKSIDAATALQQAHKDLFRLPRVTELDQIAREAMGRTDLARAMLGTESHLKTAMAAMRSPWLQQGEIFGSATALSNIIAMGRGLNSLHGFNSEFAEALRPSLGDWRDVLTPATESLIDSFSRSGFYVERGFDPQLTDFTPQAFEEGLEIAGLRESESAENDDDQQDSFARAKEAFDTLQRFEVAIRRFIKRVWDVHLTGVSVLPPRAARRRSLQAGRMSALPRRLGRNSLWPLA